MSKLNSDEMLAKILESVQGTEEKVNSMQQQMNSMQGQITSMNDRLINVEALAVENKNEIASLKLKAGDLDTTLAKVIEQELQPLIAKVDNIETKLNFVDAKVDAIISRVGNIEVKVDSIDAKANRIEGKVDVIVTAHTVVQEQLTAHSDEIDVLQMKVGKLSIDQRKLADQIGQNRQA